MAKQFLQILLILLPALFFVHCAQIGQLTGGKRDLEPPKLLEALPGNQSNNFNAERVVLRFDEFVQLKDLSGQLLVSPKLKTTPDISVDGKKITITLKKEELQPNTTYRIYMGQAIADIHENNAIQNFEYVFSTGPYIDSLKIKGQVFDAFNNKPSANTVIGLYSVSENNDSLPYKEVPDYLAKSDESGKFNFNNLPYKAFKGYAFLDKNKNYLYDGETEKVAFLNEPLKLSSDSTVTFNIFQEESSKGFIKRTNMPYYGLMQIILNKRSISSLTPLDERNRENFFETHVNEEKDTISVYYKNVKDTVGLILNNITQKKADTLRVVIPKKGQRGRNTRVYELNTPNNTLLLGEHPTLIFPTWMDILNADVLKMKLTSKEDSLINTMPVQGKWLDITHFEITNELREGASYKLKVDTSAFFDINGVSNDSSSMNFKTQSKIEFGKVTLRMLFNKKQAYIIQLINDKEQVIRESFIAFSLSSSNAAPIDFIDVQPGSYQVKVIFDDNGNKKWDTGRLLSKKQPERVIINAKQIKILSDWEIEEEISITE